MEKQYAAVIAVLVSLLIEPRFRGKNEKNFNVVKFIGLTVVVGAVLFLSMTSFKKVDKQSLLNEMNFGEPTF